MSYKSNDGAVATGVAAVLLFSPLLILLGAFVTALILFWPTMILLGAVHSFAALAWVPALGWKATFFTIALIRVLIPTGSSSSSK